MPTADTVRAKPSGFLTFVWALFFFFIFALLVMIWVRASGSRIGAEEKRAEARAAKLAELAKADSAKLTSVGWVDQAKGIVRIPIADAKRIVLAELQAKKPTVSQIKVEPPLPMPPPPDPNAVEPPPPALPSSPQGADTLRFDLPVAGSALPAVPTTPANAAPAPGAGTAAPTNPVPQTPGSPPLPATPARPPLINSPNAQ
jgi:hypothetical protein